MKKIDCKNLVKKLRNTELLDEKRTAIKQAESSGDLWEVCVLLRAYTSPQSTDAERIIKNHLDILSAKDNNSGDGIKGELKYEIKVSVHDINCRVNIRQIRPHHKIDYYILVAFNLFGGAYGEAFILRIPATELYELILKYGGYTHGTVKKNGFITAESIKDESKPFEYSLTADPNAPQNTKANKLWKLLLGYKVDYNKNQF